MQYFGKGEWATGVPDQLLPPPCNNWLTTTQANGVSVCIGDYTRDA